MRKLPLVLAATALLGMTSVHAGGFGGRLAGLSDGSARTNAGRLSSLSSLGALSGGIPGRVASGPLARIINPSPRPAGLQGGALDGLPLFGDGALAGILEGLGEQPIRTLVRERLTELTGAEFDQHPVLQALATNKLESMDQREAAAGRLRDALAGLRDDIEIPVVEPVL
ncbi:MAG: hypothetical protein ACT4PZ_12200 [Panacagrimonas sp.]